MRARAQLPTWAAPAWGRGDAKGARQRLIALGFALAASLVAGLTLGAMDDTLAARPGLLVMIPAAIGMRGTIFGALGSRLGTAAHAGTFSLDRRVGAFSLERLAGTVVGQNVVAAAALSVFTALAVAGLAKIVAVGFGLRDTIPVADLVVISVIGGLLSSAVVLVLTVGLAGRAVGAGWDLDDVLAPVITASGDMVTLPALALAVPLAGFGDVTSALAVVLAVGAIAVLAAAWRTDLPLVRRILAESLPVVLAAATIGLIAGFALESRLDIFTAEPALLVLVPPFLASAGALGGILASRLSSGLHLGIIEPRALPGEAARADLFRVAVLALPLFAACSLVADLGAFLTGLSSPGALVMLAVSVTGGFAATAFVLSVAYYGSVLSRRLGLDPDNYAIPVVTSTVDLVGSLALVLAVVVLGVAP